MAHFYHWFKKTLKKLKNKSKYLNQEQAREFALDDMPKKKSIKNVIFHCQNNKSKHDITNDDFLDNTSVLFDDHSSISVSLRELEDGCESSIASPSYMAEEDHLTLAENLYYDNSIRSEGSCSSFFDEMSLLGSARFNSVLQIDHMMGKRVSLSVDTECALVPNTSGSNQRWNTIDSANVLESAATINALSNDAGSPRREYIYRTNLPRQPFPIDFEPDELEPDELELDELEPSIIAEATQNDYLTTQQDLDNFSFVIRQGVTEKSVEKNSVVSLPAY
eukprot:CAMPEP_0195512920 /NCGR_PEP_ID=MMETSP0794_2-20130614/4708_1 /TAXON_ID=515487 /ORGANISM="Stephanopyxis turris, Strain CCMP 815" /LENGTH=277 /DNA_ID=CAMNT_0040640809 /DNA_START=72 /DNA_END=908 /DNA_ORIENTATION=+